MIIVKHFHVPFLQTESIRKHTHNTIYTSSRFMQILARVVGDDPTDGILLVVIGHKIKKHPRRISKQNIEYLLILYNIIFAIASQPSSHKKNLRESSRFTLRPSFPPGGSPAIIVHASSSPKPNQTTVARNRSLTQFRSRLILRWQGSSRCSRILILKLPDPLPGQDESGLKLYSEWFR